jgi:hypothetical protein
VWGRSCAWFLLRSGGWMDGWMDGGDRGAFSFGMVRFW